MTANLFHAQQFVTTPHLISKAHVYQSAKFHAKYFNLFARLFILLYFRSEKFRTSMNGKKNKQASEKVETFRGSVNVA